MKGVVHTYVNIRSDKPEILADNNPAFYRPGAEVELTGSVIGQSYKGNNVWYRLVNGCYLWSGGIAATEFLLPQADFGALPPHQQHAVLQAAKEYYQQQLLSDAYGVTGLYIGRKSTQGTELPLYCLCFQVKEKSEHPPWMKLPGQLPFRGFAVPVDIVQEDFLEMQYPGDKRAGRPGGTLSRLKTKDDWGSCAFIAQREEDGFLNHYLVTNYHVAAYDFLRRGQYSYDAAGEEELQDIVAPSWRAKDDRDNIIGFLYKGLFNEWHDTALVRVLDPARISNAYDDEDELVEGFLDVVNDEQYVGEKVVMYGGHSGRVSGKKIRSVNSTQRGRLGGGTFVKNELIQVEKMSSGGDSGSPVLIGSRLIGIVLGSDKHNTYLLSAEKILSFFNLTIYNK